MHIQTLLRKHGFEAKATTAS